METVKMEIKFMVAGSLPSDEVLIKEFKKRFEKSCSSDCRLAIISEISCQNHIEELQCSKNGVKQLEAEIQRLKSIISDIKECIKRADI